MKDTSITKTLVIALLFFLVMIATRFHHVSAISHFTAISLPDASLAIFFLAGFYLRSPLFFGLFFGEAVLIDYLAITYGGVSDWCITPAYFFLVLAYAGIWFAGRWYATRYRPAWMTLVPLLAALTIGTVLAFLISNTSFYLLSGRFTDQSWVEYSTRVAKYFPPYAITTFLYVSFAAFLHALITAIGVRATVSR